MNGLVSGKTSLRKWLWLIPISSMAFSGSALAEFNLKKLEKQKWVQVSTDNFTLISDQSEKTVLKLAENLERFRKTFGLIGSVELPEDARPVKVISVQRRQTYRFLTGESDALKNTRGIFNDTVSGNYAVIKAGKLDSNNARLKASVSILFHEYTHYLTANLSTVNLPYWFNEGLADYLGAIKFPDATTIEVGLPIQHHLFNLNRMSWKPIEEIFKATYISHKQRDDRYRIYSQGWLMIHYFKTDSTRSKKLEEYLNLVGQGIGVDDAFRKSFAMDFKELDKRLRLYRKKGAFGYTQLSLSQSWSVENYAVERLSTADALFELGEFSLNGMRAHKQAQVLFDRAIEIDPQQASAIAGLANIYMFKELDKAHELIEHAKSIDAESTWVSTIAGHIDAQYADDANSEGERVRFWNKAIRNYNHAVNAGGVNLEAMSSAANMYMSVGRWQKAKELIEIAFDFAPSNGSLRRQLIIVHFKLGEKQSALKIIQLVKRNNHMSEKAMERFDLWVSKVRGEPEE